MYKCTAHTMRKAGISKSQYQFPMFEDHYNVVIKRQQPILKEQSNIPYLKYKRKLKFLHFFLFLNKTRHRQV